MSGKAGFGKAVSSALAVALASVAFAVSGPTPAGAETQLHGIDVSSWQGTVDWRAVRASGRAFAFAKATEGATFVDDSFTSNRAGMAAAGMVLRGFYHFARPDRNTAAAEAAHFLSTVGSLGPGEIPVLDLEVAPGPGVGDWAAEWMRLVGQATGKKPVLYSYQSFLYSIPTAKLTGYPLWVAAWGTNDGGVPASPPKTDRWDSWTWWQYTSNATVPGVSGHVDDSVFFGSAQDLANYGGAVAPPADPLGDLLRGLLNSLLGAGKQ